MERTVVIVGRPNVGKSALFNVLVGRDISLVFDRPGTTRDRLISSAKWGEHRLTVVDTGGIGVDDASGFGDEIAHEVDLALTVATEIIFVVDGRAGLTPLDLSVTKLLRKTKLPVFVAVNKMDGEKQVNLDSEFTRLGFTGCFPISAAHKRGIEAMREAITASWGDATEEASAAAAEERAKRTRPTRLAVVGRPNVGKSSLINAFLAEPRAIVSPIAGTTRDAVDIHYRWKEQDYLFIDTAGMRQERRIHDELEAAMTGRTAHTINRADVCILVIDAATGVSMQDKKIAGLIQESKAPCIVVVNKWDLAREVGDGGRSKEREYYDQVQQDLFFIAYAPVVFVSAKTGERLDGLLKMATLIAQNRHRRFPTGPLNRVLMKAMEKYPPPLVRGRRFKILYAAQPKPVDDAREIPTLHLFVNHSSLLTSAYERYLELQLRESFDLRGCPLKFIFRNRKQQAVNEKRVREQSGEVREKAVGKTGMNRGRPHRRSAGSRGKPLQPD